MEKGRAGRNGVEAEKSGAPKKRGISSRTLQSGGVLLAYLFSLVAGLPPLAAVLLVGAFSWRRRWRRRSPVTGINPMEIFIIILLAIRAWFR